MLVGDGHLEFISRVDHVMKKIMMCGCSGGGWLSRGFRRSYISRPPHRK